MKYECVDVLQKMITYKSITPQECGIYEYIGEILFDFEKIKLDFGGVKNIFFYKKGSPKSKHICFAGHIDVVPAGEGWSSDPFSPTIKDGYLYGRGAQDMKGGIASFLCAIREALSDEMHISVLLTSDEEGDGIYGTKIMLEELKARNMLPDIAIVAEPTSIHKVGDTIKVGRRGSINGVIKIHGIQGHSAYPNKCKNPIEILGSRLGKLAGVDLDSGDKFFEPTKIVLTDIRAGMEVCNVTPSELKIMLNVRNSSATSVDDLEKYIKDVMSGVECEISLSVSSLPFLSKASFVDKLSRSVEKICSITPDLSTSGGTSDARFFAFFGVDVVELGVQNDRIHAVDERVLISDLDILKDIFVDFLKQY